MKIFVMDVDGTLTDGKIYIGSKGEEFKAFNVKDGYAINEILKAKGIETAIITGRMSEIVNIRIKRIKYRLCVSRGEKQKRSIEKIDFITQYKIGRCSIYRR